LPGTPTETRVAALVSSPKGFQGTKHVPRVDPSTKSASIKAHHRIHRRLRQDDLRQLRDSAAHRLERNILVALNRTVDPARVLLGKKSLWDFHVEQPGGSHRQKRNQKYQRLMSQHPTKRAFVFAQDPLKHPLVQLVKPHIFSLIV